MIWALPLGLAALGMYRGSQQAKHQQEIEDATRKQRAAEIKYSPWTGRQSFTPINYAQENSFGAMLGGGLQGGSTGLALGQGLDQNKLDNELKQEQINSLRQGQYGGTWPAMQSQQGQYAMGLGSWRGMGT